MTLSSDPTKPDADAFVDSGSSPPPTPHLPSPTPASPNSASPTKPDIAERLISMVEASSQVELFVTPGGEPYALLPHKRAYELHGNSFREWLQRACRAEYGIVPRLDTVDRALTVLSYKTKYESGVSRSTYVRVAGDPDAVYVDLVDDTGRCAKVTPSGWTIETQAPVMFRRPQNMLPLPLPERGGTVDLLRHHINCDDNQFKLITAWLLGALCPFIQYPLLELTGPQGSAKSTTQELVRSVVDPNTLTRRSGPRSERDLFIAAHNTWVTSFDNLSRLSEDMSNALCLMSTGGAFATRQLYSDSTERTFECRCPVMINGVAGVALKSDLLERTLTVTLQQIEKHNRRAESEVMAAFKNDRALILGAFLDATSCALRHWPTCKAPSAGWTRMADFTKFVTCAEPALGWESGTFVALMHKTRREAAERALDEYEGLAAALHRLPGIYPRQTRSTADGDYWTGSAQELLDYLLGLTSIPSLPKSPSALIRWLGTASAPLKEIGIEWRHERRTSQQRTITICRRFQDEEDEA